MNIITARVCRAATCLDWNSWDLSLRCDPWPLATEAAITEKEECLGKVVPSKFNPHLGNCIKIQLTTLQFPCTIRLTMKNAKNEIVTQRLRQKNPDAHLGILDAQFGLDKYIHLDVQRSAKALQLFWITSRRLQVTVSFHAVTRQDQSTSSTSSTSRTQGHGGHGKSAAQNILVTLVSMRPTWPRRSSFLTDLVKKYVSDAIQPIILIQFYVSGSSRPYQTDHDLNVWSQWEWPMPMSDERHILQEPARMQFMPWQHTMAATITEMGGRWLVGSASKFLLSTSTWYHLYLRYGLSTKHYRLYPKLGLPANRFVKPSLGMPDFGAKPRQDFPTCSIIKTGPPENDCDTGIPGYPQKCSSFGIWWFTVRFWGYPRLSHSFQTNPNNPNRPSGFSSGDRGVALAAAAPVHAGPSRVICTSSSRPIGAVPSHNNSSNKRLGAPQSLCNGEESSIFQAQGDPRIPNWEIDHIQIKYISNRSKLPHTVRW